MAKSNEQFLAIREIENLSYHHTFSKKKAVEAGKTLAKRLIEDGNVDLFDVTGNLSRLKEVITAAESELKQSDVISGIDKEFSRNGVKFSLMNTGDRLDYEQDPIYKDLKDKLKDREEKLKQAFKTHLKGGAKTFTEAFDEETGEAIAAEVPVVSIKTHGKQTVKITY